jgi:hypothetical protein
MYKKYCKLCLESVLHGNIANQVDNQNDTEFQFNLDAFNACCIRVHKTKYLMNMQYPILGTPKIVISFDNLKGIV